MDFIIVLFVVIVGGCWLLFRAIGNAIFPKENDKTTFVDKSVHHHYHDNRSVHVNGEEFKNLKK
jgi:multidrug efflux pump subunit AcrB